MSTADLIAAAPQSASPPSWRAGALSIRVDDGNLAFAASELDRHASDRGFAIGEVVRLVRHGMDIIYAREAPANPT